MPDPNESSSKKLGDNPLFGAPPGPTEATPSSSSAPENISSDISPSPETINPLFGATQPPVSNDIPDTGAKDRIEQGSRERVETLKRLRHAEVGNSSPSINISNPAPSITRLSQAPVSQTSRTSTLIPYIRRLGFIISILLGAGASMSLIWSIFLLPRLHASFSARRALVDQQVDRVGGLLSRLREVRGTEMHRGYIGPEAVGDVTEGSEKGKGLENRKKGSDEKAGLVDKGKGKEIAIREESKAMIREISTSSAHSESSSSSLQVTPFSAADPLIPDLTPLIDSLKSLSSTRGNTSTTRTSLLSTIESYTSSLHRQLWNPRPGAGFGGSKGGWGTGYGLNTLDQSLRNETGVGAGGASGSTFKDGWEGEGLGDRSEEWDKVRKEVRGIKGMLLGRRSMGLAA